MKYCTIIISYNSAPLTQRVYEELKKGKKHDIYVIENSSSEDKMFKCEGLIDLGRQNLGYGGCCDFVFSDARFRQYDFVGILNNDVFDIPEYYVQALEKYMNEDTGLLSSAIQDNGTSWAQMRQVNKAGCRDVLHVETIATYFNTKLFDEFCKYIPTDYFGILDVAFSAVSASKGFKNRVVDDVVIGHMLSGGREMSGKKQEYLDKNKQAHDEWMARCPNLNMLYQNLVRKIQ
jgi:GT2 family glycosyltransferase